MGTTDIIMGIAIIALIMAIKYFIDWTTDNKGVSVKVILSLIIILAVFV